MLKSKFNRIRYLTTAKSGPPGIGGSKELNASQKSFFSGFAIFESSTHFMTDYSLLPYTEEPYERDEESRSVTESESSSEYSYSDSGHRKRKGSDDGSGSEAESGSGSGSGSGDEEGSHSGGGSDRGSDSESDRESEKESEKESESASSDQEQPAEEGDVNLIEPPAEEPAANPAPAVEKQEVEKEEEKQDEESMSASTKELLDGVEQKKEPLGPNEDVDEKPMTTVEALAQDVPRIGPRASLSIIKTTGKKPLYDMIIDTVVEKSLFSNVPLIKVLSNSYQFLEIIESFLSRLEKTTDKKVFEVVFTAMVKTLAYKPHFGEILGNQKMTTSILQKFVKVVDHSKNWLFLLECEVVLNEILKNYTNDQQAIFPTLTASGPYMQMMVAAILVAQKGDMVPNLMNKACGILAKVSKEPVYLIALANFMNHYTLAELPNNLAKEFGEKMKKKLVKLIQKLVTADGILVRAALRLVETLGRFYGENGLPAQIVAENMKMLERTLATAEGPVKIMFAKALGTMGVDEDNDERFEQTLTMLAKIARLWKGPYNNALKQFCITRKDNPKLFEQLVKMFADVKTTRAAVYLLYELDLWDKLTPEHFARMFCSDLVFNQHRLKCTVDITDYTIHYINKFDKNIFAGVFRHVMYALARDDETFEKMGLKDDVASLCKTLMPYFRRFPKTFTELLKVHLVKSASTVGIELLSNAINETYKTGPPPRPADDLNQTNTCPLVLNIFSRIFAAGYENDNEILWGLLRALSPQWKNCMEDPSEYLARFHSTALERIERDAEEWSEKRSDVLLCVAGLPEQSSQRINEVISRILKVKPFSDTLFCQAIRILAAGHLEEALKACIEVKVGKVLMKQTLKGEKRQNWYRLLRRLLRILHEKLQKFGRNLDLRMQKLVLDTVESLVPWKRSKMEKNLSEEVRLIAQDVNLMFQALPTVEFCKLALPSVIWAKAAPAFAKPIEKGMSYVDKVSLVWRLYMETYPDDFGCSREVLEGIFQRMPEEKCLHQVAKNMRGAIKKTPKILPFADFMLRIAHTFKDHEFKMEPAEFIILMKKISRVALVDDQLARKDAMLATYILGNVPYDDDFPDKLDIKTTLAWRMHMWIHLMKLCCQRLNRETGLKLLDMMATKGKGICLAHSYVLRSVLSCRMPYVTCDDAIPKVAQIIRGYPKMDPPSAFNFESGILKLSYINMEDFIPVLLALEPKDLGRARVLDLIFGSPDHRLAFAKGYNSFLMKQDRDDDEVPNYDRFQLVANVITSEDNADITYQLFSTTFCNLLIWIAYIYATSVIQKDTKAMERQYKQVAEAVDSLFRRTSVGKVKVEVKLTVYQELVKVLKVICKHVAQLDIKKVKAIIRLGRQMLESPSDSVVSVTALLYIFIVTYMGMYNSERNGKMIAKLIKEVARLFEKLSPKTRLLVAASCKPKFVEVFKQDDIDVIYSNVVTVLENSPDTFRRGATDLFFKLVQKASLDTVKASSQTLVRVVRRTLIELGVSKELMASLAICIRADPNMAYFGYFALNHQWLFTNIYEEGEYREFIFRQLMTLGGMKGKVVDLMPIAYETAKVVDEKLMLRLAYLLLKKLNVTDAKWFDLQCAFACQAVKNDVAGSRPEVPEQDKANKAFVDFVDPEVIQGCTLDNFKREFLEYAVGVALKEKGVMRDRAIKAIAFIINNP